MKQERSHMFESAAGDDDRILSVVMLPFGRSSIVTTSDLPESQPSMRRESHTKLGLKRYCTHKISIRSNF